MHAAPDHEILLFDKLMAECPPETYRFLDRKMGIVAVIRTAMDKMNVSQAELARRLGKSEAEVSKLLRSSHNLTLKTLVKLETALGCNLLPADLLAAFEVEWAARPSAQTEAHPPTRTH
jgi:antitoxin component HigA of HigAB toxin-antitoxin module